MKLVPEIPALGPRHSQRHGGRTQGFPDTGHSKFALKVGIPEVPRRRQEEETPDEESAQSSWAPVAIAAPPGLIELLDRPAADPAAADDNFRPRPAGDRRWAFLPLPMVVQPTAEKEIEKASQLRQLPAPAAISRQPPTADLSDPIPSRSGTTLTGTPDTGTGHPDLARPMDGGAPLTPGLERPPVVRSGRSMPTGSAGPIAAPAGQWRQEPAPGAPVAGHPREPTLVRPERQSEAVSDAARPAAGFAVAGPPGGGDGNGGPPQNSVAQPPSAAGSGMVLRQPAADSGEPPVFDAHRPVAVASAAWLAAALPVHDRDRPCRQVAAALIQPEIAAWCTYAAKRSASRLVTVALRPEGLGDVRIDLSLKGRDLQVRIEPATAPAAASLVADADILVQSLREAGYSIARSAVDVVWRSPDGAEGGGPQFDTAGDRAGSMRQDHGPPAGRPQHDHIHVGNNRHDAETSRDDAVRSALGIYL